VAIIDHYRYLDMLQQFLTPQLDEYDQCIHFQQDGAAHHYLGEVCEYLNIRFQGRWIGRAAPMAWPPRSLDLTHLDFSYGDSVTITIPGKIWREFCYIMTVQNTAYVLGINLHNFQSFKALF
jgi:hypothetical protein